MTSATALIHLHGEHSSAQEFVFISVHLWF